RTGLTQLVNMVERERESEADLPKVLPLPRNAQLVLIGDLLAPLDEINRIVRDYAARGVKGHLLQILDPAEEQLPYHGRVRFAGLEGDDDWLLPRVDSVRADYQARLNAHCEGLAAIARVAGWSYARHRTDNPPQTALLALHATLSQSPIR
ncbi:MAG: DUF58 domain-containing protein, partial [Kiloniellales bacterium]|nr:DUF58 domain-containing protein [Kiloniellales bacterium]